MKIDVPEIYVQSGFDEWLVKRICLRLSADGVESVTAEASDEFSSGYGEGKTLTEALTNLAHDLGRTG